MTTTFSVQAETALLERLDDEAKRRGVSRSALVVRSLEATLVDTPHPKPGLECLKWDEPLVDAPVTKTDRNAALKAGFSQQHEPVVG